MGFSVKRTIASDSSSDEAVGNCILRVPVTDAPSFEDEALSCTVHVGADWLKRPDSVSLDGGGAGLE